MDQHGNSFDAKPFRRGQRGLSARQLNAMIEALERGTVGFNMDGNVATVQTGSGRIVSPMRPR